MIGRERLRQILIAEGITFQRTKTWKESPDPLKEQKLARIEYLLEHARDRTFAFDEFGPLTIRPVGGASWAPKGRPVRLRANYHKPHGSRQLYAWYSIGGDRLDGNLEVRKGSAATLRAIQSIRASIDDGEPIHVILDNLNHHKNRDVRAWCDAEQRRVGVHPDLRVMGQPDRSSLRATAPVRHRQQRPRRSPLSRPSDPQLPALAQHPHPRSPHPRRRTTTPSPHPQRTTTPMGTPPPRRPTRERMWSEH